MVHPLCLLDSLDVSLTRPHANPLATAEPVVANPHDRLRAMVRSAHPGLLDHPPAATGLREDGVGVVVHSWKAKGGVRLRSYSPLRRDELEAGERRDDDDEGDHSSGRTLGPTLTRQHGARAQRIGRRAHVRLAGPRMSQPGASEAPSSAASNRARIALRTAAHDGARSDSPRPNRRAGADARCARAGRRRARPLER